MKKLSILLLLNFIITTTHAQNYNISFVGTGASTTVDSVKVENITQGTSLSMLGNDTLHLRRTQGIDNATINGDKISVYPNPMQGQTEVSFYAKQAGKAQLTIYDISGKVMADISNIISQGIHRYRITGLKQGIYFIHISGEDFFYTAKLISLNSSQIVAKIEYFGSGNNETSIRNVKSTKARVDMTYNTGDNLRFTGYSSTYTSIITDVPTSSKTITFTFDAIANCGTIADIAGNLYNTVQIGTQCWMRENLKTSKYRNNINIPNVTDGNTWETLATGAWCNYNNDTSNNMVYGKMYNWNAVNDSSKLCPAGWHVPADAEWTKLSDFLINNGYGYEGSGNDIAKSIAATSGWTLNNISGTLGNDQISNNSSGFTALPGGNGNYYQAFYGIGDYSYWWSSSEVSTTDCFSRYLGYDRGFFDITYTGKRNAIYVRCIKNELPALSTTSVTGVSLNSAISGGNITFGGGAPITARGVCWSTSSNPDITDSFTTDGSDIGSYTSNLTGLSPLTTYYVRAYATNSEGTAYGNEISFTTIQNIVLPILTTTTVSNITQTTVSCGGNVTSEGGASVTARGVCWSTSQNPLATGSHTTDGAGTGIFISSVNGLTANTTYYLRAYATSSAGTAYGNEVCFTSKNTSANYGTVPDIDGNTYNTVEIGTQCWMRENLKTTRYSNGNPIPKVTNNTTWSNLTTGAYSWCWNDSATLGSRYGNLYNWYAVNTGNLCPTGWHVPSDADWTLLTNHLGGDTAVGSKLKSSTGWYSGGNGTDDYGFTALAGGRRYNSGSFDDDSHYGFWWSSTVQYSTSAWYRKMSYLDGEVSRYSYDSKYGMSVRCLRD